MNEKLEKELKLISDRFTETVERAKVRRNSGDPHIRAKEKELETIQKKIDKCQKEVNEANGKISIEADYKRIAALKDKLKVGQNTNDKLKEQVKALKEVLKRQEGDILIINETYVKIQQLEAHSKEFKCKKSENKKLKKELSKVEKIDAKEHREVIMLKGKLQQLKAERIQWEKAINNKLPGPFQEQTKKQDDESLKHILEQLQKRIKNEGILMNKNLEAAKAEMEEYQSKVKEAEQELNISNDLLKQFRKVLRHKQLKSLKRDEEVKAIEKIDNVEGQKEKDKGTKSTKSVNVQRGSFFITDIYDKGSERKSKALVNIASQDSQAFLDVVNNEPITLM